MKFGWGPFSESTWIKNRFQIECTKQLHQPSVFWGLQTAKEPLKCAQEPPIRPKDAQHSPNLGATWRQLGVKLGQGPREDEPSGSETRAYRTRGDKTSRNETREDKARKDQHQDAQDQRRQEETRGNMTRGDKRRQAGDETKGYKIKEFRTGGGK